MRVSSGPRALAAIITQNPPPNVTAREKQRGTGRAAQLQAPVGATPPPALLSHRRRPPPLCRCSRWACIYMNAASCACRFLHLNCVLLPPVDATPMLVKF